MITNLLDCVKTSQKDYWGVVDMSTKKYIIFYDFTNCTNPSYRILIIMWRLSSESERFPVFCKSIFPDLDIPNPVIIPHNGIQNKDDIVTVHAPNKNKFRSISKSEIDQVCL